MQNSPRFVADWEGGRWFVNGVFCALAALGDRGVFDTCVDGTGYESSLTNRLGRIDRWWLIDTVGILDTRTSWIQKLPLSC